LVTRDEIKGLLQVFLKTEYYPDSDWLEFFETLVGQAAIAIGDAHLLRDLKQSNQELQTAYDATFEGWSKALDLRDKETEGDSQRVTNLCLTMAKKLKIPDDELKYIRWGSLLHDIGKMGVPDSILLKPGPLDEYEWKIMRRHPVYMKFVRQSWRMAHIIYGLSNLTIARCRRWLLKSTRFRQRQQVYLSDAYLPPYG